MHVRAVGQCLHASALNHPLSGLPTDHVVTLDLCDPEKVKPRDLPLTAPTSLHHAPVMVIGALSALGHV